LVQTLVSIIGSCPGIFASGIAASSCGSPKSSSAEKEVSAYRFVNGVIAKITDQVEIDEIDRALESTRDPVRTHLRRALELLSDRESPDYRNSIKESISAVESLVATVVGEKGTLG
jgi:hypothetical protein